MKTGWLVLLVGVISVACVPPPKNAGEVDASATVDPSSESSSGASESSTGGGETPAACIERGWDDSLATYQSMSEAAGGTYYYTRYSGGIVPFGEECSFETTIEVVAGVVVRRSLAILNLPDGWTDADCSVQAYVEEGDAVGTESSYYSVPPYTMEQLYAGCCELLAIEPAEEYEIGFGTDDAGIVKGCFANYVDCGEGCEASIDGFTGFELHDFAFGML
jgi:hypothetical protein